MLGRIDSRFNIYNSFFQIVEVSGRPFYGYHAREHRFFKVYFYNPWIMKRAADMLQTGAILGQVKFYDLRSISPTLYEQLLHVQIPKAQKKTVKLSVNFALS
jgi:hypothetical protein